MAHGPQTKPSDFGGNPDHVTLGVGLRLGGDTAILHERIRVTWHFFNTNSFVTSAALVEVSTPLTAILTASAFIRVPPLFQH